MAFSAPTASRPAGAPSFARCLLALAVGVGALACACGPTGGRDAESAPRGTAANRWLVAAQPLPPIDPLEALLRQMSVEDKVGQLLLLGFSGSDADGAAMQIAELHAGGIVYLTNATAAEQARWLSESLQQRAEGAGTLPLFIAIDHEGGAVQRLRAGVTSYGPAWNLGQIRPIEAAIQNACDHGATHGRELAALGINVNLAPVLDVWDNPRNTVIGDRSLSGDPELAARLGQAYIAGLQGAGVLAVGKHFPGHGSTVEDSHYELPVVFRDLAALHGHELVPFETAVRSGVGAMMIAHIALPLVDPVPDRPATLSPIVVTDLLRGELRYDGLIMTDDMGAMRAITDRYGAGEAAVQAFLAGNDLLIIAGPDQRQRAAADALIAAVGTTIPLERLDASVRRILDTKRKLGLLQLPAGPLSPASLPAALPAECMH